MKKISPEKRLEIIEKVLIKKQSVAEVCREYGISRPLFYRYKKRYERARNKLKALQDKKRTVDKFYRQAKPEQEKIVLKLAAKYPDESFHTLARRFSKKVGLGEHGIRNVLRRTGLGSYSKRLDYALSLPGYTRKISEKERKECSY